MGHLFQSCNNAQSSAQPVVQEIWNLQCCGLGQVVVNWNWPPFFGPRSKPAQQIFPQHVGKTDRAWELLVETFVVLSESLNLFPLRDGFLKIAIISRGTHELIDPSKKPF